MTSTHVLDNNGGNDVNNGIDGNVVNDSINVNDANVIHHTPMLW